MWVERCQFPGQMAMSHILSLQKEGCGKLFEARTQTHHGTLRSAEVSTAFMCTAGDAQPLALYPTDFLALEGLCARHWA